MAQNSASLDFSASTSWYIQQVRALRHEAMILERKRKHAVRARARHLALVNKRARERARIKHPMLRRSQVAHAMEQHGAEVSSAVRQHMAHWHGLGKCESCGRIKAVRFFSLVSGSISRNCIRCSAMAGYSKDPTLWFCKYLVCESRSRAQQAQNVFTIDSEWVLARFQSLQGKCELCDRPMTTFKRDYRAPKSERNRFVQHPTNLSLDQRTPMGGYTPENVQLVHLQCNLAKLDTPQDEFVEMCRAIAKKFEQ